MASTVISLVEVPVAVTPTEVSSAVTVTCTPSRSTSLSSGVVKVRSAEKVWIPAVGSSVMVKTVPPSANSTAVTPGRPRMVSRSEASSCHWVSRLERSRSIGVPKSTTIWVNTSFGSVGSPTAAVKTTLVGTSSGMKPFGSPLASSLPPGMSTTLTVRL